MDRSKFFKKTAVKPSYDESTAGSISETPVKYKSKVGASQSDISNELRAINITTDRNSKNIAFKDSKANIHAHYMKKTGQPDQDNRIANTNALIKSQTSIARAQMRFMRDQMVFGYTAQRQQHKDVMDVGSAINKNITSLVTFNNEILMRHIDTTEEYYRDSIFETRKIGDLLTGISNIQMESIKNTNKQELASPTAYEEISNNGQFDYGRYGKHVKGNLKNLKDMGAFMARTAIQSNPLLSALSPFINIADPMGRSDTLASTRQFGTSEAGSLTRMLVEHLAPMIGIPELRDTLQGLENTIASIPGAFLTNVNNIGDNKYFNDGIHALANSKFSKMLGLDAQETSLNGSVQFLLKSILGVNTNTEMSTGVKIGRDPMQYNTQANVAITNVIPSLLGKIYGAISGTDGDIAIDYSKGGKVIYSKNKRREVYEMYTANASNELYDFSENMTSLIDGLNVTQGERAELFDDLDKTLNYIARGNNLDFRADGFKERFKEKSGVQHEDALMYLFSQVADTVLTDLPRRQLQAVTSRTNLSRELEQNTDLNGILMSYMYSEVDKTKRENKSAQRSKTYLDKLAKDNEKLHEDYKDSVSTIDSVTQSGSSVDVNGVVGRRDKSVYGLMESILHTLHRGLIVYPINDIPGDVVARFNHNGGPITTGAVSQPTTKNNDADVSGIEESELSRLKLDHNRIPDVDEVLADVDGAVDDLTSDNKGKLGLVENLLLSPMKAAVYTLNGFNTVMTRVFQGGGVDKELDKIAEWLKDKFGNIKDNLVDRFNESETGQMIKGYYQTAKTWLTDKDSEGGFANGAAEIYGGVKQSVMETVVNPLRKMADDLSTEGFSFKESFGELRDVIFGTETDKGVLGNHYRKAFTGLGLKGKDYGRIAASTGMGLLMTAFLPGSPLMWGIIGASDGLLARSKSFSDMMFGDEEAGIEGLVDPKFKEYIPKLKRGAAVGVLTSLIAGPMAGLTVGAVTTYVNKDNLNRLFFGNKDGKVEPGNGVGMKIADAAYDKFGRHIEAFAKSQLAKTANVLDRHLIQPMKYAIKPLTSFISKTLQKAFSNLLGVIGGFGRAIGGVASAVGRMFGGKDGKGGKVLKGLLGVASLPAKVARLGVMTTGKTISIASMGMAKASMSKEEYADWKASRKEGYKKASERYKENMARIKEDETNGKSLSEKLAERKEKQQKNKNLKDASGGEKEIVNSLDGTNKILKDDLAAEVKATNELIEGNVTSEIQTTNTILTNIETLMSKPDVDNGEPATSAEVKTTGSASDTETLMNKPSTGEETSETSIESPVSTEIVVTSATDKFIGEDIHEQLREEQDKANARALSEIAANTKLTADNTEDLDSLGGGEEQQSIFDKLFGGISSLFTNVGALLPIVPAVAGIAAIVAKLSHDMGLSDRDITEDSFDNDFTDENKTALESATEFAVNTASSGKGARILADKVGKMRNTWSTASDGVKNAYGTAKNWFTRNSVDDIADDVAKNTAKFSDDVAEGITSTTLKPKGKIQNMVSNGTSKVLAKLTEGIRWMLGKIPFGGKILKAVDKYAPKIASKFMKILQKASVRAGLQLLEKALWVVGIASTAEAVLDGVMNWRRLLRVDDSFASGSDHMKYAIGCGLALGLNDWILADIMSREWLCQTLVELVLEFVDKDGLEEYKESQERFKEEYIDSGFIDADNYSSYKHPPIIGKDRNDILNTETKLIMDNIALLNPSDSDYNTELDILVGKMAKLAIRAHEDHNSIVSALICDWVDKNGEMGSLIMDAVNVELSKDGSMYKAEDIINRKKYEEMQSKDRDAYYDGGKNSLNVMNPYVTAQTALDLYAPSIDKYTMEDKPVVVQPINAMDPRMTGPNLTTTTPTIDFSDKPAYAGGEEQAYGGSISMAYAKPLDIPMQVSSDYGYRTFDGKREWHDGIDIPAPGGSDIRAVEGGKVYVAKTGYNKGLGSHVRIKHNDGRETLYGHASKLLVKSGQTVNRGDVIAEVGTTGRSTGNHLHFGVYKSGNGVPKAGTGLDPYGQYMGNMSKGNMSGSNQVNSNTTVSASSGVVKTSSPSKENTNSGFLDKVVNGVTTVAGNVAGWFKNTFGGQKPLPMGGPLDINAPTGSSSGNLSVSDSASKAWSAPLDLENFRVSSGYGWRYFPGTGNEMHDGIDWAKAHNVETVAGEPIYAAHAGKISKIQHGNEGFGNHIRIDHDGDLQTLYAHASKLENLKVGDTVQAGQKIAEVGTSGRSTGNHLHFSIYDKNIGTAYTKGIDPTKYLSIMSPPDSFDYATPDVNAGLDGAETKKEPEGNILDKIMGALTGFFDAGFSGKDWDPNEASGTTSSDSDAPIPTNSKFSENMVVDYNFLNSDRKESFIERIQRGAINAYLETGLLPSITIAQGVQETGWGDASIGNNIFGIKATPSWTGKTKTVKTHEYDSAGNKYYIDDVFRDYNSIDESILDHTKFLQGNRYTAVLAGKTYAEQANALQKAGYATDPNYATALKNLISYNKINKTDEAVQKAVGAIGGGVPTDKRQSLDLTIANNIRAIDPTQTTKLDLEKDEDLKNNNPKFNKPHGRASEYGGGKLPKLDFDPKLDQLNNVTEGIGGGDKSVKPSPTPKVSPKRPEPKPVQEPKVPDYNINITGAMGGAELPDTQASINTTLDRYYGDMADSISNMYNAEAVVTKDPSIDFTKVLKYLEIIASSTSNTVDAVKGLAPVITDSISNITVSVPSSDQTTVVRATGGNNTNVFTNEANKAQEKMADSLRNRIKSIAKGN